MISLGQRLKNARERRGLTQQQVMDLINVTDKSLSRYENNSSAPSPDTLRELIKLYDVSADYILGLSPVIGRASTSAAPPSIIAEPDMYDNLESLSPASRKKAEEYIAMLKKLEDVGAENITNIKKNA